MTLDAQRAVLALGGVRIIESELLVEFFRRPRGKNRRILNKWRKRKQNWRSQRSGYYDAQANTIAMHPWTAALIRRKLSS